MSAEIQPDLELQIAHLLLIDVVGYSKLLVNEQIELLYELNRVVRGSECFRAAEAKDKLLRLPTGDGMALLFFENPEQPLRCAIEIAHGLTNHPEIQVRMGIHSGPVTQVADVNDRINIAGAGINIAQRVLDCGDAGHILISKHVADDLAQYRHWQPHLRDLGECEVKHGLRLHIFNLCKDGAGNVAVPEKLRVRHRWKHPPQSVKPIPSRKRKWLRAAGAVAALVGLGMTMSILYQRQIASQKSQSPAQAILEKSIAVLPFDNFSDDKQNAYFADGVQDEILTDLSKVADLKVISRTSVMQYRDAAKRNARDIARALGVSHLLEGSVQRSGNHVRVTAQLIDARKDMHVWAESYDRDIADVFQLENELSERIVAELKSRLSPNEKGAIEQKPTSDLVAYDLYTRAKLLIERAVFNEPRQTFLTDAIDLLEQATRRDPSFALAYYQLAHAHDQFFWINVDRTPARLAKANAAIEKLKELAPDSGEAHLAIAKHLYWGYRDYVRAWNELQQAKTRLPNDPWPFLLAAYIERRQGRWDESLADMQRSADLDPRNPLILQQLALSYEFLRRYPEMAATLDRAFALTPDDVFIKMKRALVDLNARADIRPLRAVVNETLAHNLQALPLVNDTWQLVALYDRDADALTRAVAQTTRGPGLESVDFPHAWAVGLAARMRNDRPTAQRAFESARNEVEQRLRAAPNDASALIVLAMIDAALARNADAIREGQRAVELLPVSTDAIDGALFIEYLAVVYAWTGDRDAAFAQLSAVAKLPGHLNYGNLKLDPLWDPLRKDPRFDAIVATLAPKS